MVYNKKTMQTAVVGIGNLLMSDDGIGIYVIQELQKRFILPEELTVIDGGTKSLELLPYLDNVRRVLFVDAVDLGKAAGTIQEISGEDVSEYFSTKLSIHQIGLSDLIGTMKLLGYRYEEICLIGIQPLSTQMGYGLSEVLKKRLEPLLQKVVAKLLQWGLQLKPTTSERTDRSVS